MHYIPLTRLLLDSNFVSITDMMDYGANTAEQVEIVR